MVHGAIHPNGSNFRRAARLDVVARVRRLCEVGLIAERPVWLEWAERVPPLENHNLNLQARSVRNPYPRMLDYLLKKYPDLRFQDCYADGNDWKEGNDVYRDDHPAMQFVARQLQLMREDGLSKRDAFKETERLFQERREHLEREQKVMMAQAYEMGLSPMFATGRAYLDVQKANNELAHLNHIRTRLRMLKQRAKETKATSEDLEDATTSPAARRRNKTFQAEQERIDMVRLEAADHARRAGAPSGLTAPEASEVPADAPPNAGQQMAAETSKDIVTDQLVDDDEEPPAQQQPTQRSAAQPAQPAQPVEDRSLDKPLAPEADVTVTPTVRRSPGEQLGSRKAKSKLQLARLKGGGLMDSGGVLNEDMSGIDDELAPQRRSMNRLDDELKVKKK